MSKTNRIDHKPKAVIILEYLLDGQPVELDLDGKGQIEKCCLQDSKFVIERTQQTWDKGKLVKEEKVTLGIDMTLEWFIQCCERLDQGKVFLKGCELVLRKANQARRRQ